MNGNANKAAMSRALGAAFLNHQVEQLEKSVSSNGPSSGNWRDRKTNNAYRPISPNGPKRGANSPNAKVPQRKIASPAKATKEIIRPAGKGFDVDGKDADVVVVDASVLLHALYQIKKWCRDGREEVLIVPLEGMFRIIILLHKKLIATILALNTLDLLKKGTSSLAQKARAASRILEAQVGTNPRIRVQRDDAFVLWDNITQVGGDANTCPEWVRRIICCASWETEHAQEELKTIPDVKVTSSPKVVLAVVSSPPNTSPQILSNKLADMSLEAPLTPVPLPAPSQSHANRFEARSTGSLVASWAGKTHIQLLEVDPALPGRGGSGEDVEMDRQKRSHGHPQRNSGTGRRPSTGEHGHKPGLVERPPAVMAMMEMISQPSKVVRVLARGEKLDPDP